ncbi:MAG: 30S ribosomal protein S8 [Planctomycetota bacterium]|nr:30S ribosomal protein S8 [Planctomycetota bacterium]MDI6786906.1 30S ribosomal protein S8 [Planctomycetota bacterium]
MSVTDPIADMLTRIRNATKIKAPSVEMPASKLKKAIVEVIKENGYIKDYKLIDDTKQGVIKAYLKYTLDNESIISGLKRISKPGRRIYRNINKMDKVLDGMGIAIVSTPKGILTDHECRKLKVGGEVLCHIW